MAPRAMAMLTSSQDGSPLFKLPPELRNNIYALVFSVKSNDDGTIDLDANAEPPSKTLILTCQTIFAESYGIYEASMHEYCDSEFVVNDYLTHSFFLDPIYNPFLLHLTRVRVTYNASAANYNRPWLFVFSFRKQLHNMFRASWQVSISVIGTHHDGAVADEELRLRFESLMNLRLKLQHLQKLVGGERERRGRDESGAAIDVDHAMFVAVNSPVLTR